MLSKVHTLILGIIAERPVNPYEITKLLERIRVKDWFPVATSSVYATIKALYSKKYIVGEAKKEGNMPEKTVYSISESGSKALHEAIIEYLGSTELDMHKFDIGVMLICHVEKNEALRILENKLTKLLKISSGIRGQMEYLQTNHSIPSMAFISMKYNLYLLEAETKAVTELIGEIEKDTQWNHFLAKDLQK